MYYCLNSMIKWRSAESKELWRVDKVDGYKFRFISADRCNLWIGSIKRSGTLYISSIYFSMLNKLLNVTKDMSVNKKNKPEVFRLTFSYTGNKLVLYSFKKKNFLQYKQLSMPFLNRQNCLDFIWNYEHNWYFEIWLLIIKIL